MLTHLPKLALTSALALSSGAMATTNIDILVVYTDAAATWAQSENIACNNLSSDAINGNNRVYTLTGYEHPCKADPAFATGSSAIDNLVNIAIQETNDVYSNSGLTDVTFNLKAALKLTQDGVIYQETFDDSHISHAEPLSQNLAETTGIPYQLFKLRNRLDQDATTTTPTNAEVLNNVHALREQYDADLVVMLVDKDSSEPTNSPLDGYNPVLQTNLADAIDIGGLAMGIGVEDPKNGFAVLRVQGAITPSYVFAHEVSHLMGANHLDFRSIAIAGPQDNINDHPYLSGGKIDNWAYKNTVDSNGNVLLNMYSTLMGAVVDSIGVPILPAMLRKTPQEEPINVVSHRAWNGDTSNGGCDPAQEPNQTSIFTLTATTLPVLSTLTPQFSQSITVGSDGSTADQSACITIEYTLEDGSVITEARTLKDTDSKPRNNARMVPFYAPTIAGFDAGLATVDPGETMVGIDFGASTYQGWNITPNQVLTEIYNFETLGKGWNNITNTAANQSYALTDLAGNPAGTLTVDKKFHGTGKAPATIGAMYAYGRDEGETMALTDYFTAIRLYTPPQITISGLDNQQTYTFRLFGTHSKADGHRVVNFKLGADHGNGNLTYAKKQLGTHGNIARFVEYQNVRPINNSVILRVEPDLTVPFFTSVGLSALTYFPEAGEQ